MATVRTRLIHRGEKELGCPLTRNRSMWCNAYCTPKKGKGVCGRIAAHGIKGRTQKAIANHKSRCI